MKAKDHRETAPGPARPVELRSGAVRAMALRAAALALLALGAATDPGPLQAQSAERRIGGAEVQLVRVSGGLGQRGELIAATRDSLWILPRGSARATAVALDELARARVLRHDFGVRRTLTWAVVGWGLSGAGLTLACVQVSDGCGAVMAAWAVPWALVSLPAGFLLESSRWRSVTGDRLRELQPYARFPQGIPGGFGGPP